MLLISKQRLTAVVLAAVMAAGSWVLVVDQHLYRADAACVTASGDPCPQAADKHARKFRSGDYGNSRQLEFPKKIKDLIRDWYADHPGARHVTMREMITRNYSNQPNARAQAMSYSKKALDDDWWKGPFSAVTCMSILQSGFDRGGCAAGTERMNEWAAETNKVAMWCGGQAAIGAAFGSAAGPKGAVAGAGAGSIACLWDRVMEKAYAAAPYPCYPAPPSTCRTTPASRIR